MQKIIIGLAVLLAGLSCKKPAPVGPAEIDFTVATHYTPTDIEGFKNEVTCVENPYWENKTIKLQGFILAANVDTVGRSFVIATKLNLADTSNAALKINYIALKGNTRIATLLSANKGKHCFLSAVCSDADFLVSGACVRRIKYTIQNPEDLEIR